MSSIGVGDGMVGGNVSPPPQKKILEKIFFGNYYVKFRHFSGKFKKKLGILIIFHTYFSGKNFVPPKVD